MSQQAEPKASAGPPAIGPIDEASGEEGGSSSEGSEEALSREDRAMWREHLFRSLWT